jgi:peptide/nickel transport system permease protein
VIPVLLLVPLAATALTDLMPGDPAVAILGDQDRPQDIVAVNKQLGLDRPLMVRYFDWLGQALNGDLGKSIGSQVPVWQEITQQITQRIPVSFQLAVMAMLLAVLVAFPLAIYTASHPGPFDRMATGASAALMSAPPFVVAILLTYVATETNILPRSAGFRCPRTRTRTCGTLCCPRWCWRSSRSRSSTACYVPTSWRHWRRTSS